MTLGRTPTLCRSTTPPLHHSATPLVLRLCFPLELCGLTNHLLPGRARGGMADAPDLGSGSERIGGSSPLARTGFLGLVSDGGRHLLSRHFMAHLGSHEYAHTRQNARPDYAHFRLASKGAASGS